MKPLVIYSIEKKMDCFVRDTTINVFKQDTFKMVVFMVQHSIENNSFEAVLPFLKRITNLSDEQSELLIKIAVKHNMNPKKITDILIFDDKDTHAYILSEFYYKMFLGVDIHVYNAALELSHFVENRIVLIQELRNFLDGKLSLDVVKNSVDLAIETKKGKTKIKEIEEENDLYYCTAR